MIEKRLLEITNQPIKDLNTETLYNSVLELTQEKMSDAIHVSGDRKVYYMSAEFLIGKLLANNLMNLGIYDELASVLSKHGHDIKELESYDPEPSLGNGGLGRLAACFLDSIATLGINGEGLGLNYHYGLFKQVFENRLQTETKDTWIESPSWVRKTDTIYPITMGDVNVEARMMELDVMGYRGKKTTLRLFDLESIDESLVKEGISFDQEAIDKNLTLFLYPDDSTEKGLRLRFAQQFFMVKAGLSHILANHETVLDTLDKHVVIQINDTHPSMVVIMLIQALESHGISFDRAVEMVSNICAYTNHTILAEALETWPLSYFEALDKDMVRVVEKLQTIVESRSQEPSVQLIRDGRVHMAALSIHFSFSTNGVAALHTEILTKSELKAYATLYPHRFNNKTNGITFRRWLLFSNRELTHYLESKIGPEFKNDAMKLKDFEKFKDDTEVQTTLLKIKDNQKQRLADHLSEHHINTESIFDIQIKRLHEYKRQQLNMLYIIDLMIRIREGYEPVRPVTFFFGSKAAPAYTIAKDIIHALLVLSDVIKNDAHLNKHIQIVFVENYNVTEAEYLIPACDVSEQISLASKEASGTGNMKLMLNGAITLGTLDGANVEIADHVGEDNIYIFGKHSDEIIEHYENADYVSKDYYESNQRIKASVDFLVSKEMLELGTRENLERLHNEFIVKDWFMTLIDFDDYVRVKNQTFAEYEDRHTWAKKMIVNISNAGFFSSDRTIQDYNDDIWKVSQ